MWFFIVPAIAAAAALAVKIAEDIAYDSAVEAEEYFHETKRKETAKVNRKVKKYTAKYDLKYYTIELEKSKSLISEYELQLKEQLTEKNKIDLAVSSLHERKAAMNKYSFEEEFIKLTEMAANKEESINDLKKKVKYIKSRMKNHRSKINQIKTEKKKLRTGSASHEVEPSKNNQSQNLFPFQNSFFLNNINKLR